MNNTPNWEQVKQIFSSALEVEPERRDKFVAKMCGGDESLAAEVNSWLASHAASEGFIDTPVFSANEIFSDKPPFEGRQFGNYTIIREIGHGGMGAVYLAERSDGEFEQRVALKIVRQSIAEEQIIDRFKRERQILASLNHPNIAKLLDGGVSDRGEPYIVMEFVEGTTISDFAERNRLNLRARLELFIKVCAAVEFAHRSLIVHRDIKPGNILVTDAGEPKLLDFGLARLVENEASIDAAQTQTAFRALTPAYASPEQLRGEPITTASDTYSLGVVLYELLSGRRPFEVKTTSLVEIVRHISTDEPARPSDAQTHSHNDTANKDLRSNSQAKRATDERNGGDSPTGLAPPPQPISSSELKGDLDNIVLMSLRKEPERRYKSVDDFAEDIERHLKNLPVSARPNTLRYRSEKFVKRNKIRVLAASLVLTALIAGMISTVWQARVAARERDQAQQAQAKAEQINSFLQNILLAASPEEKGKDARVVEVLSDAVDKIEIDFVDQPELKAQALLTVGKTYGSLALMDEAALVLRRALEVNSELYGEKNLMTASCKIYLGATVLNQAKYDEAEQLLTQAVEIERQLSPAGNKDFAYALDALGELYVRKNESEKAKPLLQESVEMSDKLLGENNADSAYALISLARAQAFSSDVAGAENNYRRSVAIYRQLPPRYEVRLATALLNFGNLLTAKGGYDEGISMMREAEKIFLQRQGESFTSFASKTYLCNAYFSKSDNDQTITEGTNAITMGRKLKLEDAPDFINTLRYLGLALTRTGRAKEGEPILRESLDRSRKTQPALVPLAEGAVGECLTVQRRFAEAEPLLDGAYESLRNSMGPESAATLLAKGRLETLNQKMNERNVKLR